MEANTLTDKVALTSTPCRYCGVVNTLDNRAYKCEHFCETCSSTERRLIICSKHPQRSNRKPRE